MPNPLLNEKNFQAARSDGGWAAPDPGTLLGSGTRTEARTTTMTWNGTVSATGVLFALLMLGGVAGWRQVTETRVGERLSVNAPSWTLIALFGAIGLMFLTSFKPHLARITAPIYALVEGLVVGVVSHLYNVQYNGVVIQAVGTTTAVIFVMTMLQRTKIVKVTDRMRRVVMGATMGVMVFYGVSLLVSLFGVNISFFDSPSPLGIALSFGLAGLAAFRYLVELDFVDRQVKAGAPRHMEWVAAFGLLAATVWLYLEILRLLSKLQRR